MREQRGIQILKSMTHFGVASRTSLRVDEALYEQAADPHPSPSSHVSSPLFGLPLPGYLERVATAHSEVHNPYTRVL